MLAEELVVGDVSASEYFVPWKEGVACIGVLDEHLGERIDEVGMWIHVEDRAEFVLGDVDGYLLFLFGGPRYLCLVCCTCHVFLEIFHEFVDEVLDVVVASAAAYAARAGIRAFVLIPDGKIAMGKLAQAMMHGATVMQIQGNFDDGMRLVKEMAQVAPVSLVNSVNIYRLHGQKTAAFEIMDELGRAPDFHALPVGNAGNISAYWMGYSQYNATGHGNARPRMVGCQAAGAAPFVHGAPITSPDTIATAIRIGQPQSWDKALAAQKDSQGWFEAFSDADILAHQKLLSDREGIFCEPASAVSVAGALQAVADGRIGSGATVVCTVTGHGLKDPDTAIAQCGVEPIKVAAQTNAVREALMDNL